MILFIVFPFILMLLDIVICTTWINMRNRYFGVHFINLTLIWVVSHGWWEWAMNIWLLVDLFWWLLQFEFWWCQDKWVTLCFHDSYFLDKVNLQPTPILGVLKLQFFFPRTFKINVLFLCKLHFMLQWARPLWVGVQFPHIALLSHILETKIFLFTYNKWQKI